MISNYGILESVVRLFEIFGEGNNMNAVKKVLLLILFFSFYEIFDALYICSPGHQLCRYFWILVLVGQLLKDPLCTLFCKV